LPHFQKIIFTWNWWKNFKKLKKILDLFCEPKNAYGAHKNENFHKKMLAKFKKKIHLKLLKEL
jgi:hypothetical protein